MPNELELASTTCGNNQREPDLEEEHETQNEHETNPSFFGWFNANSLIRSCAENAMICAGITALILVSGIIFTTAFTTCSKTSINNKTSDIVIFKNVKPRFTKLHSPIMSAYSKNNVSYAFGENYAKLGTLSHGTFHTKDNGECELTGRNNRVLKPSYIFFFSCYCDYKKGDNSQVTNTTSTRRYLREGFINTEANIEPSIPLSMNDFLHNNEQSFTSEDIKKVESAMSKINGAVSDKESTEELAIVPYQPAIGI